MKQIALLFLGIILLLPYGILAQNYEAVDSLKKELQKIAEDTLKINIYNEIAWNCTRQNPIEAILYAQKAIKESLGVKYDKGLAHGYKNLGIGLYRKGNLDSALFCYIKAKDIFDSFGDKKNSSDLLSQISIIHEMKGEYEQSLNLYRESLKIKEEIGDSIGIGMCYLNMGIVYYFQSKYKKSIKTYKKSISINKALNSKLNLSKSYRNIGLAYIEQEQFDSALFYLNESKRLADLLKDNHGIAITLNSIANVYTLQNDNKRALKIYNDLYGVYVKNGNQYGQAVTLLNMGGGILKIEQYLTSD